MPGFADRLAQCAREELERYGGVSADESPLRERIDSYWRFLDQWELRGSAWSAAFVSYLVHCAGGGEHFPYSCRHSDYIAQAIRARAAGEAGPVVGHRPSEVQIAAGDIVGMNRVDAEPIAYDWAARHDRYRSHCDIVIEATVEIVTAIGGNVGAPPGTVAIKQFEYRDGVLLNPLMPNQQVFVVLRATLP